MSLNPLAAAAKKVVKDQIKDQIKTLVEEAIKYCTTQIVEGVGDGVPGVDQLMDTVSEALDITGADRLLPQMVINALSMYKRPPHVRVKLANLTVDMVVKAVIMEYHHQVGIDPHTMKNGSLTGGFGSRVGDFVDNMVLAGTVWTTQADWDAREKEMVDWQRQVGQALEDGKEPPWPTIRGQKLNEYFAVKEKMDADRRKAMRRGGAGC